MLTKSRFYHQVTKYNPLFRNEQGHYLLDEWTSISDIGKDFAGQRLHLDEYLAVEARYVQAVQLFFAGSEQVSLESVETSWAEDADDLLRPVCQQVVNGCRRFPYAALPDLVRLALREILWFRLVDDTGAKAVEFGYDYYMYLGYEVADPECFEKIEQLPLFIS